MRKSVSTRVFWNGKFVKPMNPNWSRYIHATVLIHKTNPEPRITHTLVDTLTHTPTLSEHPHTFTPFVFALQIFKIDNNFHSFNCYIICMTPKTMAISMGWNKTLSMQASQHWSSHSILHRWLPSAIPNAKIHSWNSRCDQTARIVCMKFTSISMKYSMCFPFHGFKFRCDAFAHRVGCIVVWIECHSGYCYARTFESICWTVFEILQCLPKTVDGRFLLQLCATWNDMKISHEFSQVTSFEGNRFLLHT